MPVIGHALVGLGTALSTLSARQRHCDRPRLDSARDSWILAMVVLAYLPDIAAQSLHAAGVSDVSYLTHSLGFALLSAPAAGWLLARLRLTRPGFATLAALLSVALHVALDVLQGTDRAVLWPFSSRRVNVGFALLPSSLAGELAVVSIGVAIAVAISRSRGRAPLPLRLGILPAVCVAAVLGLAVTTHVLRDRRERQLQVAKWLAEKQHAYSRALEVLDEAERWPSPAKPGRIDYLRAECFDRLGDRTRAERYYLQSYSADPSYFWVVADLALFYASGPAPEPARRKAAAPYVARLTTDFPRHPETPEVLDRVRRRLGEAAQPRLGHPVSRSVPVPMPSCYAMRSAGAAAPEIRCST